MEIAAWRLRREAEHLEWCHRSTVVDLARVPWVGVRAARARQRATRRGVAVQGMAEELRALARLLDGHARWLREAAPIGGSRLG